MRTTMDILAKVARLATAVLLLATAVNPNMSAQSIWAGKSISPLSAHTSLMVVAFQPVEVWDVHVRRHMEA